MSNIVLKNWYQLDYKMKSPIKDISKIDKVMESLTSESLVSKWFFLFEGQVKALRVRMESNNKHEFRT